MFTSTSIFRHEVQSIKEQNLHVTSLALRFSLFWPYNARIVQHCQKSRISFLILFLKHTIFCCTFNSNLVTAYTFWKLPLSSFLPSLYQNIILLRMIILIIFLFSLVSFGVRQYSSVHGFSEVISIDKTYCPILSPAGSQCSGFYILHTSRGSGQSGEISKGKFAYIYCHHLITYEATQTYTSSFAGLLHLLHLRWHVGPRIDV